MGDYYISINGGPRTLLDLNNVTSLTREQNSMTSSWLRISTKETFSAADQWPLGARCELFLGNTRIFYGLLVDPTNAATPQDQGRQYLVECPWRRFRRTPYEQGFLGYDPSEATLVTSEIPWLLLWADGSSANQVKAVCDFLIADQVTFPQLLPFAKGVIDAEMYVRPAFNNTVMCSETVIRSTQFLRDACHWWDWTAPVPTFNLRAADAMEVVTLPFGGDASGAVQWQVQRSTEQQLAYVRVTVAMQLPPTEVTPYEGFDPLKFTKVLTTITAPAGYAGPKEGGIHVQFEATDYFDAVEAEPWAQQIYASAQNLGWIGSVKRQGVDIDLRLRPGVVVNQSGGNPALANARMIVQRTVDDLLTRTTTAIFTPKRVLTVQALEQQMRNLWPPVSQDQVQEQQTGQAGSTTYGRGDNNDPGRGAGGGSNPGATNHTYRVLRAGPDGMPQRAFATFPAKEFV